MKQYNYSFLMLLLFLILLFSWYMLIKIKPNEIEDKPIIIQSNISLIIPEQKISQNEVNVRAEISSEFLQRNDVQHYNTEKQNYCYKKFEDDKNIQIINLQGISMNPTLFEGNKIICDSSIKDYKSGMIISFNDINGGGTIGHRIKAVYPNYVITQGDNNFIDDGRIDNNRINCVYIGVCY